MEKKDSNREIEQNHEKTNNEIEEHADKLIKVIIN